jgi:hypothetical protein
MPEDDLQSVKLNELISQSVVDAAEHPLDPVLMVAQWSMDAIDRNIQDYTCRITSQVFIHGRLDKERQMDAKIRHEQKANETNELSEPLPATDSVPFSVYLNFVAPRHIKGQEVIWVEGRNDGKMIAHAGSGLLRVKRMHLSPDGPIAMRGSRYPIWQVGFRNLIGKMHEIGCCDRDHEDCRVVVTPGIEVQSRRCTLIEIFHDEPKECFQFHHAKIYVDQERQIPIGYEGYGWPENPEDPPPLFEKFYYTDVQLNPGLSDIDFSPDNPAYNYPRW